MPAGFGCLDKTGGKREGVVRRRGSTEPTGHVAGGGRRVQQVFSCRDRDEIGELDLDGRRKWCWSSVRLPIFLACLANVFTKKTCWHWMLRYWVEMGEGRDL